MFHYNNLSDVEFEALCKDIMSENLGIQLERYGSGRDGGIDLADNAAQPQIVVQVKHYIKTDVASLIRALKNEVSKVERISPKKYFICCSKELTPDNKKQIFEMFSGYMDSTQNIISITEIEDFLHQSENLQILHKHFKLWIESTGILTDLYSNDIFVDSEAMLADIQENYELFVETTTYQEALSLLKEKRILIIVGQPGSGKTITSKMLVLAYAAKGYRVRYSSDSTDLSSVKNSLSDSLDTKEIILLDDCFGQAYFNMKENQGASLQALIRSIKMHPNKVMIMNSRVTIYREALENTPALNRCRAKDQYENLVIDLDRMSVVEKAKIFYNHLYFNELPQPYRDNIIQGKNYRRIVKHHNYNPRIVEFVCTKGNWENIAPEHYTQFILGCLDNPNEIWKHEYEHRLAKEDRAFLTTLYSLSNILVPEEMLKHCYNYRISQMSDIDTSVNQFDLVLSRLSGSMIKIVDMRGKKAISVANPSVNDFLNSYITNNDVERQMLCNSVYSIKQIKRLYGDSRQQEIERINKAFADLSILNYIFDNENQRSDYIVFWCAEQGLCKDVFTEYIKNFVLNPHKVDTFDLIKMSPINILNKLFDEPLCSFYGLPALVTVDKHLIQILNNMDLFTMAEFIDSIDHLFVDKLRTSYLKIITDKLLKAQLQYCNNVPANKFTLNWDHFTDLSSENYKEYVEDLEQGIKDIIVDQMHDIYVRLPKDFPISQKSWCDPVISIDGSEEYLRSMLNDYPNPISRMMDRASTVNEQINTDLDGIFE